MTDKLDMSLDDIIKQNKSTRGRGGRGNQRGGRGRGNNNNRRGSGNAGVFRGGVNRRRTSGNFNQRSGGRDVPDVWQHDMYDGDAVPRRGGGRPSSLMSGGGSSGKLLVSNLDFGVNDSDIQELFSEFGNLQKAAIHYDRSGRSLGTAEVIYQRRGDAITAMKQYNGVPLDGRSMSIQIVGAPSSLNSGPSPRLGTRGNRQGGGGGGGGGYSRGGRGGGGRGRGRGGRGGREKREIPTVEDLDAEMDAYNAKTDTTS